MIELNRKTRQDFLDREWVQKLLDAGVDMSDAKYCIIRKQDNKDYIAALADFFSIKGEVTPTYSTAELLYKLHEYIFPTIDGVEYSGGLKVSKDAPFYFAYYDLHEKGKDGHITEEFFAEFEYPIESLAGLLIQCQKRDIGIANKNINISGK